MNFNLNTSIAYPLSQDPNQRYTYQRKEYPQLVNLEEKLAKIYGAEKVIIVNSGMEAITTLFDLILENGDTILINRNLYAEAQLYLKAINRYKIIMHDFTTENLKDLERLIKKEKPKLIHLDNPTMRQNFIDCHKITEIAHKYDVKVSIDNSIISFKYYNPIRQDDADFITESYSKYICGHNDTMAGALILKKNIPYKNGAALTDFLEWRGRCVNPIQTYNIERGLETLDVRLNTITKNTHIVSNYLLGKNYKFFYCGCGGCIIIPHKKPLEIMKYLTDTGSFTAMSAYGATFNICTPSRREDSYQDYMSYIRLSIGLNPVFTTNENEKINGADYISKIILEALKACPPK